MNLDDRKTGIGGSDAPKICGVSKWGSPFTVYQEKKGLSQSTKNSHALELGNLLEPWILSKYNKLTKTIANPHPIMQRHSKYDFMIAHVDAIVTDRDLLVELKTARNSEGWGDEGTSDVPVDYLCQVIHYMSVMKLPKADIFVFFKDSETFKLFHVEHNEEIENTIIQKEKDWWENYYLKNVSPEPVNVEEASDLFNRSNGSCVESNLEVIKAWEELKGIKDGIKLAEQREEELKFYIMNYLKDNETLTYNNRKLVTWKSTQVNRFDLERFKSEHPDIYADYLKQSEYRRFLVK